MSSRAVRVGVQVGLVASLLTGTAAYAGMATDPVVTAPQAADTAAAAPLAEPLAVPTIAEPAAQPVADQAGSATVESAGVESAGVEAAAVESASVESGAVGSAAVASDPVASTSVASTPVEATPAQPAEPPAQPLAPEQGSPADPAPADPEFVAAPNSAAIPLDTKPHSGLTPVAVAASQSGAAAPVNPPQVGIPEPPPPPAEPPYGVWDRLAQCESSGNWSINTGNGYYGGLQFTLSTWRAYGGTGYPHQNSRAEQIRVAENVLAGQGWGAWPACSRRLGLR